MTDTEEEGWLDEDGICFFTGEDAKMPTGTHIAVGVDLLTFVKSLIVIDNDKEEGMSNVKWSPGMPVPPGVLGVILNSAAIEMLQKNYSGRAFMLRGSNENAWMTLDDWKKAYNTDGLAILVTMRLSYLKTGGGVKTPGQQVTAQGQKGHSKSSTIEPINIGGKDGKKF